MADLILLAAVGAILWVATFGLLYRAANHQRDLQQQLDNFEQSLPRKEIN